MKLESTENVCRVIIKYYGALNNWTDYFKSGIHMQFTIYHEKNNIFAMLFLLKSEYQDFILYHIAMSSFENNWKYYFQNEIFSQFDKKLNKIAKYVPCDHMFNKGISIYI